MIEEVWTDVYVKEISDTYQVSNLGRLKRKTYTIKYADGRRYTYKEKILNGTICSQGYNWLSITTASTKRNIRFPVHRLVVYSFRPDTDKNLVIRHLNGNKLDNRLDNLKEGTVSDNEKDKLILRENPNIKLTYKDAEDIRASKESNYTLASLYGVKCSAISKVRTGRTWQCQ